jgi:hypothetical protein
MKLSDKIIKIYEKKNNEIIKILDPKKEYLINFQKTGKKKQICFTENKKLVIVGDYTFYGIYQHQTKLWIWASSIPGVDKSHIEKIKSIKKLSYLFESDNNKRISFYYQLLTQDVIQITDDKLLKWITELLIYLSNDIFCFQPINNDDNMQFITLTQINEKYI